MFPQYFFAESITGFAKLSRAISLSRSELQVKLWYFTFQIMQVFLITTLTSSANAVASQIARNPARAVPLIDKTVTKGSFFFISCYVLYGVANTTVHLFKICGFLGVFLLSKFAEMSEEVGGVIRSTFSSTHLPAARNI